MNNGCNGVRMTSLPVLVTTYGLGKNGSFAIDQSGACLQVVMSFLGHAQYNIWTNEHVTSLMCVALVWLLSCYNYSLA